MGEFYSQYGSSPYGNVVGGNNQGQPGQAYRYPDNPYGNAGDSGMAPTDYTYAQYGSEPSNPYGQSYAPGPAAAPYGPNPYTAPSAPTFAPEPAMEPPGPARDTHSRGKNCRRDSSSSSSDEDQKHFNHTAPDYGADKPSATVVPPKPEPVRVVTIPSTPPTGDGLLLAILTGTWRRKLMLTKETPALPVTTLINTVFRIGIVGVVLTVISLIGVVPLGIIFNLRVINIAIALACICIPGAIVIGVGSQVISIIYATYGVPAAHKDSVGTLAWSAGVGFGAGVAIFLLVGFALNHWNVYLLFGSAALAVVGIGLTVFLVSAVYHTALTILVVKGRDDTVRNVKKKVASIQVMARSVAFLCLFACIAAAVTAGVTAFVCAVFFNGYFIVILATTPAGGIVFLCLAGIYKLYKIAQHKKI
ncbi:Polyadenylate-binding protein [Carpediemonas membranifera]|uniref:Polyadenylate-binding protein n=1 Tax=Carpediemonas membranifera TaxID=201153 RepID=A0A8J6B502_9EUKA|nr:Polyadenylate-binding protein [Carpediemonas membranifera]|eukprot:KAG9390162.1 Polyadenylate-binding protein [Carpediemonas membranifera]